MPIFVRTLSDPTRMDSSSHPFITRIRRRIASGVAALVPIVVTVAILRFLFGLTSSILLPIVDPAAESWPPAARAALSFGILLVTVYVLGELATNLVGRRILGLGESIVLRVPFVKVVYSASKQVAAAFERRQARPFKSVVFVEFPGPGMKAVGFVTGEISDDSGTVWNTIFVPTTPNPTTGFLQLVRTEDLVHTGYSVEDGVKLVMSLGVLMPQPGPVELR
jgi:uncharacterized membrane protein